MEDQIIEKVREIVPELNLDARSGDYDSKLDQMYQLAFTSLTGQISLMKLTEFIFVDNCLNATFEEITVNID